MYEDDRFDDSVADLTDHRRYDTDDNEHESQATCTNGYSPACPVDPPPTVPDPTPPASTLHSPVATVPGLFPRRSINLLVGDSKIGRLRFALTQFDNYAAQDFPPSFLDYPLLRPAEQIGVILCARDRDLVWHRIREMELDNLSRPCAFPVVKWSPSNISENETAQTFFPLDPTYDELTRQANNRPPRFLLVEGLQLLMSSSKQSDQQAVAIFEDQLQRFCNERDCTILGIVGTSKVGSYNTLAKKIYGATQWAEGAVTLIGIEQPKLGRSAEAKALADLYRCITVQIPGSKAPDHFAQFNYNGSLRLCPRPETQPDTSSFALDAQLQQVTPGDYLDVNDFEGWTVTLGVSLRTIRRWLAVKLDVGDLVKEGSTKGAKYRKPVLN